MRVVCPSCQSAYDVPDARLGAGIRNAPQRLRCARCGHVWGVVPPAPPSHDPVPPRPATPLPGVPSGGAKATRVASVAFPPQARPALARPSGPVIGWVLSIALLVGLGAAAWHWRQPIMAAWPPSERIYRLVGGA